MGLRFGTDGIRGVANDELTPELVLALGRAAGRVLGGASWVVGRDTRCSGPMLQAALTAGLTAVGCDVVDVGVLPTPAVARLADADRHAAAVISASHNPFRDNGVKLFALGGRKLGPAEEARLEVELDRMLDEGEAGAAATSGGDVGWVRLAAEDAFRRYCDAVATTTEGRRLERVRVVLDCANGAAWATAPAVLRALGADLRVIHAEPDGTNINAACGSTEPGDLQQAVIDEGADVGLALDGDADRVLAVDHEGRLVDGDQLLVACALDLRARGELTGNTVVVTVMSNLGLRLALREHDVEVVETPVGDRQVLEALDRGGWDLGGEQSGHIVFRRLAGTGDGLLTGLQVLDILERTGRPLAELVSVMDRLPQVLRSVPVTGQDRLGRDSPLWDEVAAVESELGERGRVLVRPSGTEPVVRVMVEAPTADAAERAADRLVDVVSNALGSSVNP